LSFKPWKASSSVTNFGRKSFRSIFKFIWVETCLQRWAASFWCSDFFLSYFSKQRSQTFIPWSFGF
jgi:hypothetical protein